MPYMRLSTTRLGDLMTEFIEIPIEKLVNGEVVTVDTKALPIVPIKEETVGE
jgi:hypothetical protein